MTSDAIYRSILTRSMTAVVAPTDRSRQPFMYSNSSSFCVSVPQVI